MTMVTTIKAPKTTAENRPKHKGGRPPKRVKRDIILRIRMQPAEIFLIRAKAKEAGMRASSWVRRAAKAAKIAPRWTPEEMELLRMMTGMANNLNQLARQANMGQLLFIARKCDSLMTEIDDALKYLTSHDGENS